MKTKFLMNSKIWLVAASMIAAASLNQPAQGADHPLRLGPDTTISYDANRSELSTASKEKLVRLVNDAKANGQIDEIQIAVWSDNPVPQEGTQLSKADQKLANRREVQLSRYLKKNLGITQFNTYNMAERASWLSRSLNLDDAKLKSEITHGSNQPMSKEAFKIFRDNGQASRAVVLVIMKQ